jgi:putative transposase
MISAERAEGFPVSVACGLLGVTRSGYYDWERRVPSDRDLTDAWLIEKIKTIHAENRGVYGLRRIHADLRLAHGVRVSGKRVRRLMRSAGISGLVRRTRGRTTIRVPGVRVADDLVGRRFRPAAPNVLWVADVTYLRTWEGWLYLAAVQDAFSRRIVGWSMADHMRTGLVVDALETGIARRRPQPGLVHHSDQGSTSASVSARRRATPASPSRWARWRLLRQRRRRDVLRDAQEGARPPPLLAHAPRLACEVFEYIEAFYNRRRRHSTLGYLSPADYEEVPDQPWPSSPRFRLRLCWSQVQATPARILLCSVPATLVPSHVAWGNLARAVRPVTPVGRRLGLAFASTRVACLSTAAISTSSGGIGTALQSGARRKASAA